MAGIQLFHSLSERPILTLIISITFLVYIYLYRLNQLISKTPEHVQRLSPPTSRWSKELLRETYKKLEANPITTESYAHRIPPKLDRRYIVTGGSGLVGGYIVLQLVERGQPPESIRIVDFRLPNRHNMTTGPAANVDFVQTDISSVESTNRAFSKPWDSSVAHLPLTVFHTAAIIVPSERSKLVYGLCEAVNVSGTRNVVNAARQAGADVLVSTTSGSIAIRRINFWIAPWKLWDSSDRWPRHYWQLLDEKDFSEPPRRHDEYFANYPASKAAAERIVCDANARDFRTGCIRPANGVYGNPTDNTIGGALSSGGDFPTWTCHIIQSFVHGINAAIAHLHFEAVLAPSRPSPPSQSGKPFIATDPNPPITFGDLYFAIEALSTTTHFRAIPIPPVLVLVLSHLIEWYTLFPLTYPIFRRVFPPIMGDIRFLQPAIMDICTHLVASNSNISQPVEVGGLGYRGIISTLDGMVQEIVEWNREHREADSEGRKVVYHISIALPDQLKKAGAGVLS